MRMYNWESPNIPSKRDPTPCFYSIVLPAVVIDVKKLFEPLQKLKVVLKPGTRKLSKTKGKSIIAIRRNHLPLISLDWNHLPLTRRSTSTILSTPSFLKPACNTHIIIVNTLSSPLFPSKLSSSSSSSSSSSCHHQIIIKPWWWLPVAIWS